jgi:serine/threonine protein kinase
VSESPGAQNVRDVGSVVANRYAVVRHLGTGRYGEIYEAVDRSLSGAVALHLLSDRVAQQTRLLKKLESSYQQPHTWSHANIVQIRGFGTDAGRYFVVMEWLEGDTLRSLLDENRAEPPSETEAFSIVRGVGDALKYAHAKGAIHGDIRPQKIFLTTDRSIKVLDLLPGTTARSGLYFVEDASPTSLAPPDQRDDVYGLACVAYELLTGKHPFDGRSPRVASSAGMTPAPIPGLGPQRWAALARGLALRREQRTPNVAVFLVELGVASSEPQRGAKPAAEKRATAAAPPPPARSPEAPASRAQRKEPPPLGQGAHVPDDDMPIIGDYSGTYPKMAPLEPRPEPKPERQPGPPQPPAAADNTWRIDPRDVRRHAQPKKKRGPEPGDVAFRLGGLLIGGLVAFAIFSNYDTLRDRVAGWIDVARNGAARPPSALPERRTASENETIEVQAPTVVPTPDLPPEDASEPAAQNAERLDAARSSEVAPASPEAAPGAAAAGGGGARAPAVAGVEVAPEPPRAADVPIPAGVARTDGPAPAESARTAVPPADAAPAEVLPPAEPARPVEPETFAFASSVVTVSEGQPGARVTIRRRGGAGGESSVVWWTSDDTAAAGEDYANLGRSTEKFARGEETRTILVPIIGDAKREGRESFYVNLGDPLQPDSRDAVGRVEVVIEDDD